jgi:hypothetical protein
VVFLLSDIAITTKRLNRVADTDVTKNRKKNVGKGLLIKKKLFTMSYMNANALMCKKYITILIMIGSSMLLNCVGLAINSNIHGSIN